MCKFCHLIFGTATYCNDQRRHKPNGVDKVIGEQRGGCGGWLLEKRSLAVTGSLIRALCTDTQGETLRVLGLPGAGRWSHSFGQIRTVSLKPCIRQVLRQLAQSVRPFQSGRQGSSRLAQAQRGETTQRKAERSRRGGGKTRREPGWGKATR